MSLTSYLSRLRSSRKLTALSARVVDDSREPLLNRILPGIIGLSGAEAKGYIRAWSRSIVRRQVAVAIPVRSQHDTWLRSEVAHRAINDVVNRVYWDAMRTQIASRPTEQRRAA